MAKEDLASRLSRGDRAARDEQQGRCWHRDSYHRFFEGWTEYTELAPSGKARIKRVYTAEYYSPKMSEGRWRMYKLLYFLALAASFAVFAVFAYQFLSSNAAWYVALPQAFCVFAYIFAFWFLINRFFAPVKMTVSEHREAETNLKIVSLILSALLAVTALASFVHCLILSGGVPEMLAALGFLLSGAAVFLIYWNERRTEYVRVPNENLGMSGSVM